MSGRLVSALPVLRDGISAPFSIHEGSSGDEHDPSDPVRGVKINEPLKSTLVENLAPLTTSKRGNQSGHVKDGFNVSHKKQKSDHGIVLEHKVGDKTAAHQAPMAKLLAKLTEQQLLLKRQQEALSSDEAVDQEATQPRSGLYSGSKPDTPTSVEFGERTAVEETKADLDAVKPDAEEMERLKQALLAANSKIARMDQELSQTRITKHTLDQALGPASEADFTIHEEVTEQTIANLQSALNASMRPPIGHGVPLTTLGDGNSDSSDALSAGHYSRSRGIWADPGKLPLNLSLPSTTGPQHSRTSPMHWGTITPDLARPWFAPINGQTAEQLYRHPQPHRPLTGHQMYGLNEGGGVATDTTPLCATQTPRLPNGPVVRAGNAYSYGSRNTGYGAYPASSGPLDTLSNATSASYPPTPLYPGLVVYQPRPIGTPLSPTAPEFNTGSIGNLSPWNTSAPASPGQTYVSPIEPLNYRRLLDRTVNCNWKYIVDKIVCNNDQQASIFLQQKLKIGTTEQKYEIVEAIVAQAYPLMVNRFGNFLVQRCFEHGTPEQVVAIANAIRGNTLNLSMDAFGCHVVQKAFDSVPEEYKAIMVHELLRRIPETVIHRYACHVWQKLFELRWDDSPPQIMRYVNEALRGMWHEVALGETGSLVVQNIFENCLEEDKRPCINEVLASIDIVAHGQFGNWCIQHICEHGFPVDRGRAIDHVVRYASEYSMDQFASKVVEKCLKIGGTEFLERYLDRVCAGRSDRPRIPLIDIASDQYGNYLIQYILTHSSPQHREIVASHIRKHMVSLRGSKFGSRVGMLCCNPAVSTRPGPGAGPAIGRFGNPRFGGAYHQ